MYLLSNMAILGIYLKIMGDMSFVFLHRSTCTDLHISTLTDLLSISWIVCRSQGPSASSRVMPTLRFCWFVVTGKRHSLGWKCWFAVVASLAELLMLHVASDSNSEKGDNNICGIAFDSFDPENPVGPCRVEHMRNNYSWISWWKAQIWALQWFHHHFHRVIFFFCILNRKFKHNDDLRWCTTRFSFANLYCISCHELCLIELL